MKVAFLGDFGRYKINLVKVIVETKRLLKRIDLLGDVNIYFVRDFKKCSLILRKIPRSLQKTFKEICEIKRVSFYFNDGKKDLIIVNLQGRDFLLRNKRALIGLLLHEVIHFVQSKRGLYKRINRSFNDGFKKNMKVLNRLRYSKKKTRSLFNKIGLISNLLLKDLYGNTELIKRGLGNYLLEYYYKEFSVRKVCPRPVFYDKFKRAVKRNVNIIEDAFEFEFALLSVVLPFDKLDDRKAKELKKHISRCYELNINEIARKCRELVDLYSNEFSESSDFQKKFFAAIFAKVYYLLN